MPDSHLPSRSFAWCCHFFASFSKALGLRLHLSNPRRHHDQPKGWAGQKGRGGEMCNYTHVAYSCGHCRYTVRAWCEDYEKTHKRCPLHVVAIEKRYVVALSHKWIISSFSLSKAQILCSHFSSQKSISAFIISPGDLIGCPSHHLISTSFNLIFFFSLPSSSSLSSIYLFSSVLPTNNTTESTNAAATVSPSTPHPGWRICASLRPG